MKLTFAHGASPRHPEKLFNSDLEDNARRAIDFFIADSRATSPGIRNFDLIVINTGTDEIF
jgi:hypothetical protein